MPHKLNDELYWQGRREFAEKYGAHWIGEDEAAPGAGDPYQAQFEANLKAIADVITSDDALVEYLSDRLVELGESVPEEIPAFRLDTSKNPWNDPRLWDYKNYPEDLFVKPGTSAPNRAGLAKWGAWVNSFGRSEYGRPLFVAMSADLAESTNIAGFANGYGGDAGLGPLRPPQESRGLAAAAGDHRVHQLGDLGGHRLRQPLEEAVRGVRRLLRGALDLRLVQLPEVRRDASLQPDRPGLRHQGRQGALGGRALRAGDGRGLADALRHLRDGRDSVVPRGPHDQPDPLGAQRGAGA